MDRPQSTMSSRPSVYLLGGCEAYAQGLKSKSMELSLHQTSYELGELHAFSLCQSLYQSALVFTATQSMWDDLFYLSHYYWGIIEKVYIYSIQYNFICIYIA